MVVILKKIIRKIKYLIRSLFLDKIVAYDFDKEYAKIPENFAFKQCNEPLVSIIIPTYNQYKYTKSCLWSILKNTPKIPYEIIIGDDCSQDETQNIADHIKGLKFIRHEQKEGFLLNVNKTVSFAKGEYIVLMNNDIVAQKNWLKYLLKIIKSDKNIGYVGARYLYADGTNQEVGSLLDKEAFSHSQKTYSLVDQVKEVDFCSACGVLLKKATWDKVGGFDAIFKPAYYEDVDLCFKIKYHLGLKVMRQPKAKMYHFQGVTYSEKAHDISNQNRVKFLNKWRHILAARTY